MSMFFLNPAYLLALPFLAALLFYLYLKNGRTVQRKISSVFFVKQLKKISPKGRRKLFLPFRLILELVIISLLISILAGLILNNKSGKLIILVDNSLSMSAQAPSQDSTPPEKNKILLDEAKASAASNIGFFSNLNQVSVWTTSPKLKEITNGFVSSEQAKAKIAEIQFAYAEDNLAASIPQLNNLADKVLIFSDYYNKPGPINDKFQLIEISRTENTQSNIALHSLKLNNSISSDNAELEVSTSSYIKGSSECLIEFEEYIQNGWSSLGGKKLKINNAETQKVTINLAKKNSSSAYRASLKNCSLKGINSIRYDDKAWLAESSSINNILVVSDLDLAQLKLNTLAQLNFSHITPDRFQAQQAASTSGRQLIIFHRYLPKTLPQVNTLIVNPESENSVVKGKYQEGENELVSWNKDSPLLKYLTFPQISFERSIIFNQIPAWASPLMQSSLGQIGYYGNYLGKRLAVFGFEIFPFEGESNLAFSILTLNTLNWLLDSNVSSELMPGIQISVTEPISESKYLDSYDMENSSIFLLPSSLHYVANNPGIISLSIKDKQIIQALNYHSAEESDLSRIKTLDLSTGHSLIELAAKGLALDKWLIIAAISILLIDSLILLRRRKNAF